MVRSPGPGAPGPGVPRPGVPGPGVAPGPGGVPGPARAPGLAPGGAGAVLLAAALWGTTGTAASFAPAGANPVAIGAARIVLGGLLLVLIGLPAGLARLAAPAARWWAVAGAVSVAGYQLAFFSAVASTGVAIGTLVAIGSAPVLTGVISRLTGGPPPGRRWLAATCLAIAGAAVLVTGGQAAGVRLAGAGLGLLAGFCYSVYAVAAARLITSGLRDRAVMGGLFGGAAVLLVPVLLAGPTGWLLTARGAVVALHLGVITTAVAYLLYARGLRTIPAPVAVTLGLAEPAVAALLALVVLGERLSADAIAGIVLIGIALVVLAVPGRAPPGAAAPGAAAPGRLPLRHVDGRSRPVAQHPAELPGFLPAGGTGPVAGLPGAGGRGGRRPGGAGFPGGPAGRQTAAQSVLRRRLVSARAPTRHRLAAGGGRRARARAHRRHPGPAHPDQ